MGADAGAGTPSRLGAGRPRRLSPWHFLLEMQAWCLACQRDRSPANAEGNGFCNKTDKPADGKSQGAPIINPYPGRSRRAVTGTEGNRGLGRGSCWPEFTQQSQGGALASDFSAL